MQFYRNQCSEKVISVDMYQLNRIIVRALINGAQNITLMVRQHQINKLIYGFLFEKNGGGGEFYFFYNN